MTDKNLISIRTIVKNLEQEKMTCDWSDVLAIQAKITFYKNKLDMGVLYEPAF
jgi:hypothetical protein